jgi:hypothetical protein
MAASSARGNQRVDFEPRWYLRLTGLCGGGAPLRATLMAIPETSPEYGVVRRVWRSPRTRERRAERRVGGPRARERDVQRWMRLGPARLGSFGLGVLHAVGQSVRVHQHCGVRSCTAVALSVWCCLPPYSSFSGGFLFCGFVICICADCGWSCGGVLSLPSSLCAVLTVLMSQSDRPTSIV